MGGEIRTHASLSGPECRRGLPARSRSRQSRRVRAGVERRDFVEILLVLRGDGRLPTVFLVIRVAAHDVQAALEVSRLVVRVDDDGAVRVGRAHARDVGVDRPQEQLAVSLRVEASVDA